MIPIINIQTKIKDISRSSFPRKIRKPTPEAAPTISAASTMAQPTPIAMRMPEKMAGNAAGSTISVNISRFEAWKIFPTARLSAVSYTHLDVYKRQARNHVMMLAAIRKMAS